MPAQAEFPASGRKPAIFALAAFSDETISEGESRECSK